MHATFEYPKFLVTYESRTCNPLPLFGLNQATGTSIHGTEGTLVVNRRGVWVIPKRAPNCPAPPGRTSPT